MVQEMTPEEIEAIKRYAALVVQYPDHGKQEQDLARALLHQAKENAIYKCALELIFDETHYKSCPVKGCGANHLQEKIDYWLDEARKEAK